MRGGPPFVWEILDGRAEARLTEHEAVEKLDAGEIYAQAETPIRFRPTLRATLAATGEAAEAIAADPVSYGHGCGSGSAFASCHGTQHTKWGESAAKVASSDRPALSRSPGGRTRAGVLG